MSALRQAVTLSAGTVTPHGFLTGYDGLKDSRALGSRRLATALPVALANGTRIVIDDIAYAPGAVIDPSLRPRDRDLLLNQFGRSLCRSLARRFLIVPKGTEGAMRVWAAITEAKATSRTAAAASAATSLLPDLLAPIPVPSPFGIRLPIGLGALTTEIELVDADGKQVAAMALATWRAFSTCRSRRTPSTMALRSSMLRGSY